MVAPSCSSATARARPSAPNRLPTRFQPTRSAARGVCAVALPQQPAPPRHGAGGAGALTTWCCRRTASPSARVKPAVCEAVAHRARSRHQGEPARIRCLATWRRRATAREPMVIRRWRSSARVSRIMARWSAAGYRAKSSRPRSAIRAVRPVLRQLRSQPRRAQLVHRRLLHRLRGQGLPLELLRSRPHLRLRGSIASRPSMVASPCPDRRCPQTPTSSPPSCGSSHRTRTDGATSPSRTRCICGTRQPAPVFRTARTANSSARWSAIDVTALNRGKPATLRRVTDGRRRGRQAGTRGTSTTCTSARSTCGRRTRSPRRACEAARRSSVRTDPLITIDHPGRALGDLADGPLARGIPSHVADLEAGKGDRLPALSILHLPNDHTVGITPWAAGRRSSMADNDYAPAASWRRCRTARAGRTRPSGGRRRCAGRPDHVDAHRSVAFVISAYNRRGALVHEMHNTVSLIRTMELSLGPRR